MTNPKAPSPETDEQMQKAADEVYTEMKQAYGPRVAMHVRLSFIKGVSWARANPLPTEAPKPLVPDPKVQSAEFTSDYDSAANPESPQKCPDCDEWNTKLKAIRGVIECALDPLYSEKDRLQQLRALLGLKWMQPELNKTTQGPLTPSSESPHMGADVDGILKKLGSIIDFHEKYNDCSGTWDPQNNQLIEHADRCQKCELRDLYEDIDGLRLRPLTANSESPLTSTTGEEIYREARSLYASTPQFYAAKTRPELFEFGFLEGFQHAVDLHEAKRKESLTLMPDCLPTKIAELEAEKNQLSYELDKSRDSHMRKIAELEAKLKDCVAALERFRDMEWNASGRSEMFVEICETLARVEGK